MTRRLRRELGLAVPWGVHTFLSMAKEKCAKESQRHGDSGKKASIAHFGGGARYVARSMIGQISPAIRRAPNSPFSAIKMGGPFSLRCLSPLCSPQSAVGRLTSCRLKWFLRLGGLAAPNMRVSASVAVGVGHTQPLQGFCFPWLTVGRLTPCQTRKPRDLPSSDGLYQPAGRKSHQTREPRGLSPSGGKTPDNLHVPLRPCAP